MNKKIKLNEKELRLVINEAVRKVLKEDNDMNTNSRGETIALSSQFKDGLGELENMCQRLKGFIGEYNITVKSLLKNTKELGLQLKNFSTEKYFDLSEALSGQVFDFNFEFSIPNVDVSTMSDEEYEQLEAKINDMYDELEYMTGHPSFGTLRMYTTEDGIEVNYAFKLSN